MPELTEQEAREIFRRCENRFNSHAFWDFSKQNSKINRACEWFVAIAESQGVYPALQFLNYTKLDIDLILEYLQYTEGAIKK